ELLHGRHNVCQAQHAVTKVAHHHFVIADPHDAPPQRGGAEQRRDGPHGSIGAACERLKRSADFGEGQAKAQRGLPIGGGLA
ncbi:MAG: hypothetical protein KJ023_20990, partial [Burkholderiaceae bacterium]|nr:hypothetical protein [Burkholderiaceae bacterium]